MTAITTAHYAIRADAGANMLRIRFETLFWDAGVVDALFNDVIGLAAGLRDPVGALTLVDLSNAILQSADVIAKIQNALCHGTTGWIALVASSPLARMQTKRLLVRDGIRLFGTVEEGEDWLLTVRRTTSAATA